VRAFYSSKCFMGRKVEEIGEVKRCSFSFACLDVVLVFGCGDGKWYRKYVFSGDDLCALFSLTTASQAQ